MNSNVPEISIIVAVYKAEKYIRRCLDSILAQTFTNFEVLLIDDGSPDKSGEICDEYVNLDRRFKVIHKSNGGVASARQCGIEKANGIFSIHVDPDDWIEPDCLELMYNTIKSKGADICCCSFATEYEGFTKYINIGSYYDGKCKRLTWGKFFCGSLLNKLIRHDLYIKQNIIIPENLKIYEDAYVIVKLLESNAMITGVDKYLYHYDKCINANSLSNNYDLSYYNNQMEFLSIVESWNNSNLTNVIKDFRGNIAHSAFYYDIFSQKEYTRQFKKYFFDIITSSTPTHQKFNVLLSILGFKWLAHPVYKAIKNMIVSR